MSSTIKVVKLLFPRLSGQIVCACLFATWCTLAFAQDVDPAHANSGKYRAFEQWRHRVVPFSSNTGEHDTLKTYADKCDAATEIHVPGFSCSIGDEPLGQGTIPQTFPPSTRCNYPNVLNGACDPGSRFQVLPGFTADAVAVAHCRKNGKPIEGNDYNDIAVIQYNKKNGALCFYQALTDLPGENIPSPSRSDQGTPESPGTDGAAWSDNKAHWITPQGTEAIGCTGCHDNGGFIRSEYLAQLKKPPNVLPNQSTGFNNLDTPSRYVGLDYATNRSWSIATDLASNDPGLSCTTCHRLAVPNRMAFGQINGTAAHFADVATAEDQCVDGKCSKTYPHSDVSPIWMRPGQILYDARAEASATRYHDCAVGFFNSGFKTSPPSCEIRPLGEPWTGGFASSQSWEDLGGNVSGWPAAATWGKNRLDIFDTGSDVGMYHKAWTGTAWYPPQGGWEPLGGAFIGPATVVSWGNGRLDIFALGADNSLKHKAWTGTNWYPSQTEWEPLGGVFDGGRVAAVSWGSNRIDIVGIGGDHQMHHKTWTGSAWYPSQTEWEPLGGTFGTAPVAAVSWGKNRLDIFGVGGDHHMYHKGWTGTAWYPSQTGWEPLGGVFSTMPGAATSAVSWSENRLDIFGLAADNSMLHKAWTGTGWYPSQADWEPIGGTFAMGPSAVSRGTNRLDVFGLGTDHSMYHKAWTGTTWYPSQTNWEPVGGLFGSMPVAVSWGENRIDVFGRDRTIESHVLHRVWTDSTWSPP